MKRIETLLRQTIGLDAASIGSTLIHRAVRSRMRGIGVRKVEDYEELVRKSATEWHELVELVLVAETWFFREPEQFTYLTRVAMGHWLPKHRAGIFRILSLPCSSGEEPYSLVMALRDAGLPADRLRVDAVDISTRALARASQGVYRKNSFRGHNLIFRDRYFQASKEGFVLHPVIREAVNFYAANLLSDDFAPTRESYDCIFCRNLLIYFDRATQRTAVEKIARLLRPGGVLFVGPAEQPLVADHGFISADTRKVFAFHKTAPHAPYIIVPRSVRPKPHKPAALVRPTHLNSALHRPMAHISTTPEPALSAQPDDLASARELADAGRLEEAARICEARLRQRFDCAECISFWGSCATRRAMPRPLSVIGGHFICSRITTRPSCKWRCSPRKTGTSPGPVRFATARNGSRAASDWIHEHARIAQRRFARHHRRGKTRARGKRRVRRLCLLE